MSQNHTPDAAELKDLVLRILGENRTMTIATLRPDGWPQATIVGYVHDGLTLYCTVSRYSQKLANLQRDPRSSIAIGHHGGTGGGIRGLSMAAQAETVTQFAEIDRLNELIHARYPGVAVFAPRDSNSALLRIRPHLLSLVDEERGLSRPLLLNVSMQAELSRASPGADVSSPSALGRDL
jgi:Pyridoxamine 5'-phosphate oxidase